MTRRCWYRYFVDSTAVAFASVGTACFIDVRNQEIYKCAHPPTPPPLSLSPPLALPSTNRTDPSPIPTPLPPDDTCNFFMRVFAPSCPLECFHCTEGRGGRDGEDDCCTGLIAMAVSPRLSCLCAMIGDGSFNRVDLAILPFTLSGCLLFGLSTFVCERARARVCVYVCVCVCGRAHARLYVCGQCACVRFVRARVCVKLCMTECVHARV